jgi:hypothetical protein
MRHVVLILCLTFGLVSVGGCSSRPTEPVKKAEGGNMDRLKKMPGGANPLTKGQRAAPKGGANPTAAPNTNADN